MASLFYQENRFHYLYVARSKKNPFTEVKGQYHQAVGWLDAWLGFRNWTPVVIQ
jgi:hypothetical protein